MTKPLLVSCVLLGSLIASVPLDASSPFSQYRGVTLGDSLTAVITELKADATTVKVLHEQPSLIQELTWRPQRFVSGSVVTADPLAEIVFTFHVGQLVRMAATYDRDRIHGLTDADLRELVSAVYGVALLPSQATSTARVIERRVIGSWGDEEAQVALWSQEYPRRSGLTISAPAAAARMDEAAALAAGIHAAGEPLRRRALETAAAAAIVDREALIRAQNKARFKP